MDGWLFLRFIGGHHILHQPVRQRLLEDNAAQAGHCAEAFAQQDSGQGRRLLRDLIDQLPPAGLDPALLSILDECKRDLAEDEAGHLEVLLLALHTLDVALGQFESFPVGTYVGRPN